jgi:hypothetical protein
MKKQKMSLEKMKGVLSNVLSRDEMKEVMAGSGGGSFCGICNSGIPGEEPGNCYRPAAGSCTCSDNGSAGCH